MPSRPATVKSTGFAALPLPGATSFAALLTSASGASYCVGLQELALPEAMSFTEARCPGSVSALLASASGPSC